MLSTIFIFEINFITFTKIKPVLKLSGLNLIIIYLYLLLKFNFRKYNFNKNICNQ